jgi:hypothetical protein
VKSEGRATPAALPRTLAMRWLRDNGLTIVLLAAFGLSVGGMALTGWRAEVQTLAEHGAPPIGLLAYLRSGDFLSALFENWESEFLQMSAYVVLTAILFQRGSAESRDPDRPDADPRPNAGGRSPFARVAAWLYAYSLGIALAVLFLLSFLGHLHGSIRAAEAEALLHGGRLGGARAHMADARFWFESLQNWQSEFLATAALAVLSIFLRFHGSPESKNVEASHRETGK